MKLYKLDLLTLLISLFILSGCQNTDSIGLEIDPSTGINGNFIDTVTVRTATVKDDSVETSSLTQYPLGYFNDPLFGTTSASIALSAGTTVSGITFGTSPILDSAVLVLHYGDEFYGDSTSRFRVEVRQLAEQLQVGQAYYNNRNFSVNNSIIASQLVTFRPKDSVRVTEIVTGAPDVDKTKAPQVRIPLDPAFITNNFLNADPSHFASNEAFNRFIKGFYLSVNPAQTIGPGGVVFLNLADSSRLDLYYRNTNSNSGTDTINMSFPISSSKNPVAAKFNHDYTGTNVQTQLNNPNTEYSYTYVQGLGGLRTRVRFPYLENLRNIGTLTINKAELVISVEGGTDDFKPAPRLTFYMTDIAKQRQFVPDFSTNPAVGLTDIQFGGFYDASKKRYVFNVTTYIQDILRDRLKQYDAYIAPVTSKYDRSYGTSPSGTTAGRAVIGSGKDGVTYKMKLNIFYSKLN